MDSRNVQEYIGSQRSQHSSYTELDVVCIWLSPSSADYANSSHTLKSLGMVFFTLNTTDLTGVLLGYKNSKVEELGWWLRGLEFTPWCTQGPSIDLFHLMTSWALWSTAQWPSTAPPQKNNNNKNPYQNRVSKCNQLLKAQTGLSSLRSLRVMWIQFTCIWGWLVSQEMSGWN